MSVLAKQPVKSACFRPVTVTQRFENTPDFHVARLRIRSDSLTRRSHLRFVFSGCCVTRIPQFEGIRDRLAPLVGLAIRPGRYGRFLGT